MRRECVFSFSCLLCVAVLSACSTPKAPTPLPPDMISPEPFTSPIPAPTEPYQPQQSAPYPVELPATEQPIPSEIFPPMEKTTPLQATENIGIAISITEAPTESFFPNAATMETVNACSLLTPDEINNIMSSKPVSTYKPFANEDSYGSYCGYSDDDGMMVIAIGKGRDPFSGMEMELETLKSPFFGHFEYFDSSIYVAGGRLDDSKSQEYLLAAIQRNDVVVEIQVEEKNYKYDYNRENNILLRIAKALSSVSNNDVMTDACLLVKEYEVASYIPVPPPPKKETKNSDTEKGSICIYTSDEMELEIGISYAPGIVDEFRSYLETQINQNPSLRKLPWLNTEIYLASGENERSGIGDAFESVIIKGDVIVTINGKGDTFKYDFERELSLLKNVAARLP